MSQKALYRKYRSTSFAEVLGQEHIVSTLQQAVKSKSFGHAYLFTGPRGVGKTSIARLLAHEIIGETYAGDSPEHIDIIEIDAASNTGVDDVRELRELAYVGPAQSDYKIYIIDEVHMLSKAAFNALLKILEEPPKHIVFILATTEAHKVPETVISRTQRFGFRPITKAMLTAHLLNIAKQEKIKLEHDAAELIAEHGRGSFRDAISLLDQLRNHGDKISSQTVRRALGQLDEVHLRQITEAFTNINSSGLIKALQAAEKEGAQATEIAQQLAHYWHKQIIANRLPLANGVVLAAIEDLLKVSNSIDPQLALEITLIKHLPNQAPAEIESKQPTPPAKPKQLDNISSQPAEIESQNESKTKTKKTSVDTVISDKVDDKTWKHILDKVKAVNNSLYALLRMCQMNQDGERVILRFSFPFHQRRMQDSRNQDILLKAINEITGTTPELGLELDQSQPIPKPTKSSPAKANKVMNVLGGEMVNI